MRVWDRVQCAGEDLRRWLWHVTRGLLRLVHHGNVCRSVISLQFWVIVFRVGNDDNLAKDFVELIATSFFISSPLDEDIKTKGFDDLSRILPARLLE
jgi:hypothetical protein